MDWIAGLISAIAAFLLSVTGGLGTIQSYVAQASAGNDASAVVIIFGGDMMFDRTVRTKIDMSGGDFIFSCIDDELRSADLVVANLEGPITAHASLSATSTPGGKFNYTFTFPPSTAALLYAYNIRVVNLGNNHILNFGMEGLASTTAALRSAGVGYFGDPGQQSVATTTIRGVSFAFINFNQFEWSSTASTTIAQIRAASAAGEIPVVYTHWGEEYQPATDYEKRLAHEFVDAGAEMVVGSHPHVVQEHEVYNGKYIYYSLGNFIFDQYWNEAVRTGLLLKVSFDSTGVRSVEEIPVHLEHDRTTCPIR